ncbi:hypothetical protein MG293_020793 [Ovis ammon polii]|uniref:Uncharacterized protein n=1 Tax=Ovis ammon polii TaxID=230172 RepID=A0AAD4XZ37_OVIAM|nr:hypothetical protein MG293_020793 [Ovis ammon polii]
MKRAQFWTADSGHSQLHMTLSRTEIPLASPSSNNTNTSLLLIKSHFKTVTGLQRNEIICLVWGCGTDCHEESVAAWPLCSNSCLDGKFRSLFCCNVFRLYTCREIKDTKLQEKQRQPAKVTSLVNPGIRGHRQTSDHKQGSQSHNQRQAHEVLHYPSTKRLIKYRGSSIWESSTYSWYLKALE